MNTVIVTNDRDRKLFLTLANNLHCLGYKIYFMYIGYTTPLYLDKNIKIQFFLEKSSILESCNDIRDYLLNENYDFVFTNFFDESIKFNEIKCEVFQSAYFYDKSRIPKYNIDDYNVIDFDEITMSKFMLKYTRDKKIKFILENE